MEIPKYFIYIICYFIILSSFSHISATKNTVEKIQIPKNTKISQAYTMT